MRVALLVKLCDSLNICFWFRFKVVHEFKTRSGEEEGEGKQIKNPMLWRECVPFTRRTVAVLVSVCGRWVVAALNSTGGVRVGVGQWWRGAGRGAQEPVKAATTVLKRGSLLLLPKYFTAHGFKHPWVHKGLTKTDGLVAGHGLIPEETVQGDVCQHYVHSVRAQKAVMVGLQVVAPPFDLHIGVEIRDDAAPDVGGPERLPGHSLFWGRRRRQGQWMERTEKISTNHKQ